MTYASTQLTLNEYIQDWLINAKVTKRRATWLHYEELHRIYISPTLGHLKLKKTFDPKPSNNCTASF